MKLRTYILVALMMHSSLSFADTLNEVLVKTYNYNPTLKSAEESIKANNELMPQALAGWRPTISANASISHEDVNISGSNDPRNIGLTITQPLYKGGATVASTESADNKIRSSINNFISIENSVLLSAVEVYVDVIRYQNILILNKKNVEVLQKKLEATEARFEVGELTLTDVSQARASLSKATAEMKTARGDLNSSIAKYNSIVGEYPKELVQPFVDSSLLPVTREAMVNLALEKNPSIISASYSEKAASSDIEVSNAELLPEVDLIGSFSNTKNYSDSVDSYENTSIKALLSMPLYNSGASRSRIRQSKYIANSKKIDLEKAKRQVFTNTIEAWENYSTAMSNMEARQDQIQANEIALSGLEEEELVGARDVLDVLDAEQDLLDSKVELIKAQRDKIYSFYELQSIIGALTAKYLQLPVSYWEAEASYNKMKNQWWGTEIE